MKIIKQGFISPKAKDIFGHNAWSTVISLADGTLLTAWSGNRLKHICPFGTVLASRSEDGGYTWGEPYVIQKTPLDDRDAGLCLVGDRILMTSFAAGRKKNLPYLDHWLHAPRTTEQRKMVEDQLAKITDADEERYAGPTLAVSKDGGYTFSEPVHIPLTSPHGPMVTKEGEILHFASMAGNNGIFVERFDTDCNVLGELQPVAQSTEENTIFCEPYAAQMPNGDILGSIRVQNKYKNLYTIYLCRSTDGGKTFSTPEPTGWVGLPPHIFVTSRGEVVMTYGRREFPMGIRARISRDNGYTWSDEISLRDDGLDWDLGYPSTTENKNGELVTVYYMKDEHGLNANRIQYTIWSLD